MKKVDVIIPVYRGIDEVRECIESVLARLDRDIAQLIVINDASPEAELVAWLENAAQSQAFTLLHNEQNLGFVATVNFGMQLNPANDVVLLNSDVVVAGDWLPRLQKGAYQRDKIASVTPFSNNATICSFPNFCRDNSLAFGLPVQDLDKHFAECFNSDDAVEVPTGVGFCMFIRRDSLDEVGYFDLETFGKGYGEENDWCQRAEKAGWVNLHQANVFVYHKGGVSFDKEQEPRKAKALELLAEKHPDYNAKVMAFIQQDPAQKYRVEALWKLLASLDRPKILLVCHRLGGGVQQHVNELCAHYKGEALFLQLKPFKDGRSVSLSISDQGAGLFDSLNYEVETDYDKLYDLLKNVGVGRVHFHHVMGLHPKIWSLPNDLGCAYDITVHDYYFLNGNPTLIDESARYVGDGSISEVDQRCGRAYPIPVSAEQWRRNHKPLIERAERVIFPSVDSLQRYSRYYSVSNAVVSWHPDYSHSKPYPLPQLSYVKDRPLKVLVLGALSREKGADLMESVAITMADESIEFHLLGYAYRELDRAVITHGPYESGQVLALIRSISPDVVWFPAQWPETYSYTLSSALQTALPVVAPQLGAFPERLAGRANSALLPHDASTDDLVNLWRGIVQSGVMPTAADYPADNMSLMEVDFYASSYLVAATTAAKGVAENLTADSLVPQYFFDSGSISKMERLLKIIWGLSRLPLIREVIRWIPFESKRRIKRFFSPRPIHEILNYKKT